MNSKKDKAPTSTSLHQGFRPPADGALQEWDKACGQKLVKTSSHRLVLYCHENSMASAVERRNMVRFERLYEQNFIISKRVSGRTKGITHDKSGCYIDAASKNMSELRYEKAMRNIAEP